MNGPAVSTHDFLAQVDPFQRLPAAELDRLAGSAIERHYVPGESIYGEGDPAEDVWIVREGRVEIIKYSSTGRPLAIEALGPAELFGVLCRLDEAESTYPCTAIAATPAHVIAISDASFRDLYHRLPGFVAGLCALCSRRFRSVQKQSCQLQEKTRTRLASLLLDLFKKEGPILHVSKRELAELSGHAFETTIRTVSAFAKKGWVVSRRGEVEIKEPGELEKFVAQAALR